MEKKIVLASGSPRRIQIMRENGYDPVIMPADIEENIPIHSSMTDTVMFLALKKALWARERTDGVIIASDTIVYKDGIMGKPRDEKEAFHMLYALRNDMHYVVSGVCIINQDIKCFYDITKVYFKDYSKEELIEYIKTDEPYDKAGGYAIQGTFKKYIDHYEGSYLNVVGFPWEKIEKELKDL
ncbi:MAG: Maf family protein [Clostridia bacterium]|nr:Maf family protein [Clostridia bacterium]